MAPSFQVKLPDSILDILYKCTIGTNSLPADSSKHCGKTGPSLSKYHFAEASPYHAIHLSVTSLFSLNVTLTSNLLHVALKLALLQPLQTFQDVSLDSLGLGSENSLYNRRYHLQSGERARFAKQTREPI